ncbi:CDP-diacylglycerol--glycerol-3-phosphate 3-phosphatidyltransferase [Sporosalibacterium faouarense]|uniref:CDP-diacylglycerol--glycerol-3-phosphate 3-phosphatidyltransferase n=1 Tax=Sporosalibacterium faouarense TaxID=516123 RepID=UPI00141D3CEE|nr:CDP-diacylglycerol--glycerol-3-phosphate 3-phosphatidyltransferase [Sporosalibacterium faouarense]MTI48057.1 CDP-diacylglycerol--glycerol-3-phosphate 3-phosphatidyltransferase [Bacillota bacterium]
MNLANKLTIFRIILVPVFMIFLLTNIKYGQYIASGTFIIAAITDQLDGHIARSRNMVTKFGKFMDPLADKLLVSAALISLTGMGVISAWITVIIISRELAVTGLRVLAASEGIVLAASWWGKIKTITQMIGIILVLLNNFPFSFANIPMDMILIWLSAAFTIISGVDYFYKNKNVFVLNTN